MRCLFFLFLHSLIANGDLISPASRLLIPRKALNQWDHVLQMVTEKITLRSGAVHRCVIATSHSGDGLGISLKDVPVGSGVTDS